MTNIEDAALAALAEERAAAEAAEQAERDRRAQEARTRLAEVLVDKVDPQALTVQTWDGDVVTATDGETTLAVDARRDVRLAEVRDGKPTQVSEPVETLADLGRAIEKRGR